MAIVRRDNHGLFVIAGGYLARPQPNKHLPHMERFVRGESRFAAGIKVKARHYSQSTYVGVKSEDGTVEEDWFVHSKKLISDAATLTSTAEMIKRSEECWNPSEPVSLDRQALGVRPLEQIIKPF